MADHRAEGWASVVSRRSEVRFVFDASPRSSLPESEARERANKTAVWGSALLLSTGRCQSDLASTSLRVIGFLLLDGLVTWANVGTGSKRKHAEAGSVAKSSTLLSLESGWSC